MPRMPTFEEIAADFARGVRSAEQRIEHPFRHDADAATETPAPGPVTLATASPPQEARMSLFTEAKTIFHDGLERLEAIDENAIGAVEAIKVNPTGVSIVNTVASIAHLPDPQGLLSGADALLKTLAAALTAGVAATVPDVQAAPAGPSVAGQA